MKPEYDILQELGTTALATQVGEVIDEFMRQLRGANGAKQFREMSDNDDVIGAVLFAFNELAGNASWWVEPASLDREDLRRRDFIDEAIHDMDQPWTDVLSEAHIKWIYGFSPLEIVFKDRKGMLPGNDKDGNLLPRSKYNDGKLGWHKWATRPPESLLRWKFGDHGEVEGMFQTHPTEYKQLWIPREKFLLFRTTSARANPEGKSLLRNAWRNWFIKKGITDAYAVGMARDLSGYPTLTAPKEADIWNEKNTQSKALFNKAFKLIRSVARHEKEGMVLPFDWVLKLTTSGGTRQFDLPKAIELFNQGMAMSMLGDVLLIGHKPEGSYALATNKGRMLGSAIETQLSREASVMNRHAVPQILHLNGEPEDAPMPQIKHGPVEVPDLVELAEYINKLSGVTAITLPDDTLEEHLRKIAKLPAKSEEEPELRQATEEDFDWKKWTENGRDQSDPKKPQWNR